MAGVPVETVDVLVIGAGFSGLGVAKVYMECAPATNLVIVDINSTIGGTWSKERKYPGLRSNNLLGTFEFSDFPMHRGFGVRQGEHIPGETLHSYLAAYAETNKLSHRIRFRHKVLNAEKLEGKRDDLVSWKVQIEYIDEQGQIKNTCMMCRKMIVSTGLTSQTLPWHIKGQEDFDAPIIAQPWFGKGVEEVLAKADKASDCITVLGGSKSSYDAVHTFASRGFKVNWVIRKSGHGPTWMSPSHVQVGPWKMWLELLVMTRAMSWLSPCIWGDADGYTWIRALLHRTRLGRWTVNSFFNKVSHETISQSGLSSHPSLRPLIADQSLQWSATGLGVLNYPDNIHDYICSGQVSIHRQDIAYLSRHAITLADGTALPSSAGLVSSSNWSWAPNISITPTSLHPEMGFPSTTYPPADTLAMQKLDEKADAFILSNLPGLKDAPPPPPPPTSSPLTAMSATDDVSHTDIPAARKTPTPWRLYRFLAPPGLMEKGDNSIAFAGYQANLQGRVAVEMAGLWIYAYFNDRLSYKEKDLRWDAAVKQRYMVLRFPWGFAERFPDFVFEQMPWFDVLLGDLGLQRRRKGNWWREMFEPYRPADYRGLAQEWLVSQGIEDKCD